MLYEGLNNDGQLYIAGEKKVMKWHNFPCYRKFVRDKNIELTAEDFKKRWAVKE